MIFQPLSLSFRVPEASSFSCNPKAACKNDDLPHFPIYEMLPVQASKARCDRLLSVRRGIERGVQDKYGRFSLPIGHIPACRQTGETHRRVVGWIFSNRSLPALRDGGPGSAPHWDQYRLLAAENPVQDRTDRSAAADHHGAITHRRRGGYDSADPCAAPLRSV